MSPIPSQRDYEMRELSMFRKQMEQVERLPLAERKENAREWLNDLMNDQKLIAERVGWLLNGSYGKGSFDSACRVLASPRMNQVAWCAITIANLEWRCPAKMAIESWKKLPVETRYQVNEAIRREIADAKAEGYCGEIKKNPSGSEYGGDRKRIDLIHRLRKHPYVAGFMKRQLTTYYSKKKHFFKRGSVAFVSNMGDGFVRLHHGTRGGIDRKNFAVLYITDLDGKFVPNNESLDIYG